MPVWGCIGYGIPIFDPKLYPDLKKLIQKNRLYIILWLQFSALLIWVLSTQEHVAGFLFLNPSWVHTELLTWFFLAITWLGDGIFIIILFLISFFIFKWKKFALLSLFSYALSGIIVQVLKNLLDTRRPLAFLHDTGYPYFSGQITVHTFNSFPSGHSATAFAWTAIAVFCLLDKRYSILLFLMAMLVGYSRIFLGQHFPEDVLAGAAIGIISASACFLLLGKKVEHWTRKK